MMLLLPDLQKYPILEWSAFKWLFDQGVPIETLIQLTPIHYARGVAADDGWFDESPDGDVFIAFPEATDTVFWSPRSNRIATAVNRSFALGEDALSEPGALWFGNPLKVWPTPLQWLRHRCDGVCILDWSRAWSRLQDMPRIAVHQSLVSSYRKHMHPPKGPETFVLVDERAAA